MKNLQLDITPLMELHNRQGVIRPHLLRSRTRIAVQTQKWFYEMEVGIPKFSVVLLASEDMPSRDKVVFIGCTEPDTGEMLPGVIGKGLHMMFKRKEGYFSTPPVVSAKLLGEDYDYDLWQNHGKI